MAEEGAEPTTIKEEEPSPGAAEADTEVAVEETTTEVTEEKLESDVVKTSFTPHDVVLGKGNGINCLPGNQMFRSIITRYKPIYAKTARNIKASVAELVINEIACMDPPGRFLEPQADNKLFKEIPRKRAIEKTCQALREKKSNMSPAAQPLLNIRDVEKAAAAAFSRKVIDHVEHVSMEIAQPSSMTRMVSQTQPYPQQPPQQMMGPYSKANPHNAAAAYHGNPPHRVMQPSNVPPSYSMHPQSHHQPQPVAGMEETEEAAMPEEEANPDPIWPLRDNDVLYGGRGRKHFHRFANQRFLDLIKFSKNEYQTSRSKKRVAMNIISKWRRQTPPGRFLQQNSKDSKWYEISQAKMLEKTSQALRDLKRERAQGSAARQTIADRLVDPRQQGSTSADPTPTGHYGSGGPIPHMGDPRMMHPTGQHEYSQPPPGHHMSPQGQQPRFNGNGPPHPNSMHPQPSFRPPHGHGHPHGWNHMGNHMSPPHPQYYYNGPYMSHGGQFPPSMPGPNQGSNEMMYGPGPGYMPSHGMPPATGNGNDTAGRASGASVASGPSSGLDDVKSSVRQPQPPQPENGNGSAAPPTNPTAESATVDPAHHDPQAVAAIHRQANIVAQEMKKMNDLVRQASASGGYVPTPGFPMPPPPGAAVGDGAENMDIDKKEDKPSDAVGGADAPDKASAEKKNVLDKSEEGRETADKSVEDAQMMPGKLTDNAGKTTDSASAKADSSSVVQPEEKVVQPEEKVVQPEEKDASADAATKKEADKDQPENEEEPKSKDSSAPDKKDSSIAEVPSKKAVSNGATKDKKTQNGELEAATLLAGLIGNKTANNNTASV